MASVINTIDRTMGQS